ncbi:MAG: hypothetical protein ACRCS5_00255 [Sphingomonas sp.]|uniref:hypothetical protein n=1 Tax=Sphingomonas sp. TaxID=28214 RepID=UPI0030F5CFDA
MRPRFAPPPAQPAPAAPAAPATPDIAFTPVPSASPRHDGWTPERQRAFLQQLARIGVVSAAAGAVGMSAKSAYALRKRAGAESFAAAWEAALGEGRDRARDLAIERALIGTATPIFYRGRQIGVRQAFDNRLVLAVLRAMPSVEPDAVSMQAALAALGKTPAPDERTE